MVKKRSTDDRFTERKTHRLQGFLKKGIRKVALESEC